jgi:hypothetical protein
MLPAYQASCEIGGKKTRRVAPAKLKSKGAESNTYRPGARAGGAWAYAADYAAT